MPATYDIAIIGAGIVGLATALELTGRHPGLTLVVLEKEARVAAHQSGRNSGVIHSGIYYKPGSYKARMCVAGAKEMVAFCREHDLPIDICGKVVVAVDESELPSLNELYARGQANGVPISDCSTLTASANWNRTPVESGGCTFPAQGSLTMPW